MAPSSAMPVLHGRGGELAQLDAWLELAAAGSLQIVLVEGEAGMGKTSVLDAALRRARERRFRVFAGRADEVERVRPFGPLAEALRSLSGSEIGRLLTTEAGLGPIEPTRDPGLQFRIVDAVVECVEEAAVAGPIALAIDDLHWADPSTQLTLRSLGRRLVHLPVALLMTLRPLPRTPELERLLDTLGHDGAHHLVLGPLDEQAVAGLVTDILSTEPSATLLDRARDAAGNPFFVTELVRALEDESSGDLPDAPLPPSLRLMILRRLSFLGDEAVELLRIASFLGSPFTLRDVATVLGRSPPQLLTPVHGAIRAGVLEEHESRLRFRHDLIREAVYEDIPEDMRAAIHSEAGRRLAETGAPALQVAEQFARGARSRDEDAASWLHTAGREAARRSPQLAAELMERALGLTNERVAILADLVPTLLWTGRPHDAESRAREALDANPPAQLDGPLRLGLVRALAAQGRDRELIDVAQLALDEIELTPDLRSRLQAEAANALAFMGDLDESEAAAREAVATGIRKRSEGAAMGLLVLSDAARVRGRLREALAHAEDALELGEAGGGTHLHWRPEIFLAMALRNLDRFEDAGDAIRRGRKVDERLGNVSYLPVYHYESASQHFFAGRWDEAVAEAEAGLALGDEVGLEMLRQWPYGLLARIAFHRGDPEAASESLAAVTAVSPEASIARAFVEEARGELTAALATLRRAWDLDTRRGVLVTRRLLGPDLVRLALAADDHSCAAAVAAGVAEAAAIEPVPGLEGAAFRCRGLAEADAGLLLRAVDAYRRSPRAFERAQACEDAATALARTGRRAEAKPLFDEALDCYDDLRARHDSARALRTVRELGLGRKRRGARKRPATGWDALTPSELEVVELAAAGLTNPEIGRRLFISPRTVQTHLKHAFQKLGLTSRVELAAKAARRDLPEAG